MEVNQQIELQFLGIGFPNMTFLSKQIFTPALHANAPINSNIKPKVFYPANDKKAFSIILDTKVTCADVFELSVLSIGNFRFLAEPEKQVRNSFVNINAPAILFPYVRAFISTLTSNLGFVLPSILLPPQFFAGELEELTLEEMNKSAQVVAS